MELFEFKDEEVYPLAKSKGGSNMKVIHCKVIGAASNYAVCLHRIDAKARGNVPENVIGKGCCRAIDWKECPAQDMRRAEEDAGHALHYIDRTKYLEQQSAFFDSKGWVAKTTTRQEIKARPKPNYYMKGKPKDVEVETPVQAPPPKQSRPVVSAEPTFADAINVAMKELEQQPKEESFVKPGMSLVEIARARMQQKGA